MDSLLDFSYLSAINAIGPCFVALFLDTQHLQPNLRAELRKPLVSLRDRHLADASSFRGSECIGGWHPFLRRMDKDPFVEMDVT